jgi:hypothetical protein
MTAALSLDTYRLLGRSGLRVSPLSLGTTGFGASWGSDADTSRQIFDSYIDRGGNFASSSGRNSATPASQAIRIRAAIIGST